MNSDKISVISRFPPGALDPLIVLVAIMLASLFAFSLVLLLRKAGMRPHNPLRRHYRRNYRERFQKGAGDVKELIRQHRRRREPRPVNPTLAQTGGLPPVRKADEPPTLQ